MTINLTPAELREWARLCDLGFKRAPDDSAEWWRVWCAIRQPPHTMDSTLALALADAMEELAALKAKLEEVRWVPVTERTPTTWDLVLVIFRNDPQSVETAIFQQADGGSDQRKKGRWYSRMNEFDSGELSGVTHWMPIPAVREAWEGRE